jgi:hypothetical protein
LPRVVHLYALGALFAVAALIVSCKRVNVASPVPTTIARIAPDTIQAANDRFVAQVLATLRGQENRRADSVFRNVTWLNEVSVRTFLDIMNAGYSRGLGVTCAHCHNTAAFDSDEKRPKRAAREMQRMHRGINQQLREMKNLGARPSKNINCATCHRGKVSPLAP